MWSCPLIRFSLTVVLIGDNAKLTAIASMKDIGIIPQLFMCYYGPERFFNIAQWGLRLHPENSPIFE